MKILNGDINRKRQQKIWKHWVINSKKVILIQTFLTACSSSLKRFPKEQCIKITAAKLIISILQYINLNAALALERGNGFSNYKLQ